jgi:hypothetical protein
LPLTSCQFAGVVAAHHVPVLLHEEHVGPGWVHGDAVHAVADLGVGSGIVVGVQAAVDRLPGRAAVVGAEGAGRRDGDEEALRIARVEQDGVQAHAAGAGLPDAGRTTVAQAGSSCQVAPPSVRAEQGGVLDAGVDRVGSVSDGSRCQTRLNSHGCCVPSYHWCVPGRRRSELVADRRPGLPPSSERWISWPNQPLDCEA